jgi:hypothetical protein
MIGRTAAALALASAAAGCRSLESEGYRGRGFEDADTARVFKACVEAVQIHGGGLAVADVRNGRVVANWQRYPPVGAGEARPAGSDKYRSRAEAVVERAGAGARAHVRVVIERREHERRGALAGLAPSDLLHDYDRGPTTPLQEQVLGDGGFGTRWIFYRTDPPAADAILQEIAALLRSAPTTGARADGREAPDAPPPTKSP